MRKYKPYVIPLRPHSQLESVRNTTQVTPVAAVEEKAKVEHAKDVKEDVPFVKVLTSYSIKRKHSQSSVIPSKKAKTSTSTTRRRSKKKKNSSKPVKPKKKSSNQTKRKPVKKQQKVSSKKPKTKKVFKIDSYKSIFKH